MYVPPIYTPEDFRIVHSTSVDFKLRVIQKPVHLVQYDKRIPVIKVYLYLNNEPFVLEENMGVKVRWSKKDRGFFYGDVLGSNEDRNAIYFEVTEQMSFFDGMNYPIIELYVVTDTLTYTAGSSAMAIIIDRNPIQVTDLQSISEYGDFEKAKEDAEMALIKAEEAIEIANSTSAHLGETSTTAYRGDRGKIAYDHSQSPHAPVDAQKNSDITKDEIEAKLTGAITSHTHPDITKDEIEAKLTGVITSHNHPDITKDEIEAKLTGVITSHTHPEIASALKQIYFNSDLPDEEDWFVNMLFMDLT